MDDHEIKAGGSMMEKLEGFGKKCAALAKKAGIRGAIAVCAVLILGGAWTVNYMLSDRQEPAPKLAVDLTKDGGGEKTAGEDGDGGDAAASEDALASGDARDYFASIALERRQARDEAIEVLRTVTESGTATGDAKAEAAAAIEKIASGMEREADIESLIRSRGFEQCVAVLRDDGCSVIVESDGLMQGDLAQISEIVWEQAGIAPENLKIIERAK